MNLKFIFKLIVAVEVLSLLITALAHLILFLVGEDVSNYLPIYWIVPVVMFGIFILSIITFSVFNWWMNL